MNALKALCSTFWLALKGVNPLTNRRLHPFQQQAIRLNFLMMAIGCIKLIAGFWLRHEQQRLLEVVLALTLTAAGLALAMQIRERLLLKLQRQGSDRP